MLQYSQTVGADPELAPSVAILTVAQVVGAIMDAQRLVLLRLLLIGVGLS